MGRIRNYLIANEAMAQVQRMAAFGTSFYLTMEMFVEMVRGDPVKEIIFRCIAFVYESSKITILKKSFTMKTRRIRTRILALALMVVSVTMASMSAAQISGAARAAVDTSINTKEAIIADLSRQRDALLEKIEALPETWRTSSLEYQKEVTRLQEEINSVRMGMIEESVVAQKTGGVFDDVASLLGFKSENAPRMIRFLMFVLVVILIECILYAETYIVAEAELKKQGKTVTIKIPDDKDFAKLKTSPHGEVDNLF